MNQRQPVQLLPSVLFAAVLSSCAHWQATGRETYREFAAHDSLAARAFFEAVREADYRFLVLPDYGQSAIGMYTPAHDSVVATYGTREMTTAHPRDRRVLEIGNRIDPYNSPYNFAEYYNQALFAFLSATSEERACYVSQTSAFGSCSWTPLPTSATPPAERPEANLPRSDHSRLLDAVLTFTVRRGEFGTIGINADLGSDGVYSLARVGLHDRDWLESLVRRQLVDCIAGRTERFACRRTGVLTRIALGAPRRLGDDTLVVHVHVSTHDQDRKGPCHYGCYFGEIFDAKAVMDTARAWTVNANTVFTFN